MSTKNRTAEQQTRNIRFPNPMGEQINIALEQKGSKISPAWVIETAVGDNVRKESIYIN